MRRTLAAEQQCVVVLRVWLCIFVAVLVGDAAAQDPLGDAGRQQIPEIPLFALTVTTAEELFAAFMNHNVSVIYLGGDIELDSTSWETGERSDPESGIVLERSVTLTTHPSLEAPAILYLDFMQNRVLAGEDILIRINGVVLTGVSNDARNYFFVPFFQFGRRGTVLIENSQFQLAIQPQTLWSLSAYPQKMNSTARPKGYENWPVEAIVVSPEQCVENYLRKVDCGHGAIFVGSLAARLTVFDENLRPVGKAAFLAKNVLMIAEEFGTSRKPKHKLVHASTALEFKKALQDPLVTEIHVTQNLSLTQDTFPNSIRTPITRNLTISSEPLHNRSAVINFNYLQSAIVASPGVEIKLVDLTFTRVSKNPLDFELVPFFSLQPGAMYVYRNVVSEMAISPEDLYPLSQLPFALYGGDVPEQYGNVTTNVKDVTDEWCIRDGRIECPDGALWIKRGIRRLQVLDVYNQEVLGEGYMDTRDTLIKAIDITKRDFDSFPDDEDFDEQEIDNVTDEVQTQHAEEERRSFGFIGGFDPWILIYVLIAAAALLGVCLVGVLWRRRDQRHSKKGRNLNANDLSNGEDDIHAHQRVAQQLLGDVKLGSLLGCGSFGRVYKAMWSGAPVAVKVILHQEDEAEVEQEAKFSVGLRHPNVVQTFQYAVRTVEVATPTPKAPNRENSTVLDINCTVEDSAAEGTEPGTRCTITSSSRAPVSHVGMSLPSSWMKTSNGGRMFYGTTNPSVSAQSSTIMTTEEHSQADYNEEQWLEMWLIQEYCNLGSLGKQNYLRINDQHSAWRCRNPPMQVIIDTCKDIARGMKYLHDNGIVHGDLKCDNVLLQSSHVDTKGFTAKVADFGLSRKLGQSTHLSTKSFGTITHMPPELLLDGHLSSKVDIYSFGVIMWELETGQTPFKDLRYAEVMRAIIVEGKRPQFEPDTQEDYVALAQLCWDRDPQRRPSFDMVLEELDKMSDSPGSLPDETASWESDSAITSTNKGKGYSA